MPLVLVIFYDESMNWKVEINCEAHREETLTQAGIKTCPLVDNYKLCQNAKPVEWRSYLKACHGMTDDDDCTS